MPARDRSRSRRHDGASLTLYHNGEAVHLEWCGKEHAAELMREHGMIDDSCASFLIKASDEQAFDILRDLGPACKNLSAVVTRKLKSLKESWQLSLDAANDEPPVEVVTVYLNGTPRELKWFNKRQAISTLAKWGVLDEEASSFIMKAPDLIAVEILQSLGPECRNPSAVVTRKLKELKAHGALEDVGESREPWSRGEPAWKAPHVEPHWQVPQVEVLTVHCNGEPRALEWHSLHHAAATLCRWGMLDEGSAEFLVKAPEEHAKDIVAQLGPTVKNASAVVTKKLKALQESGLRFAEGSGLPPRPEPVEMQSSPSRGLRREAAPNDVILVHKNGQALEVQWTTLRQVAGALYAHEILDAKSACFLVKAPEEEGKHLLESALGPDCRNPSATVTRALKQLELDGVTLSREEVETIIVVAGGEPRQLLWFSHESAVQMLVNWGLLDEGSASFLAKAPEHHAKNVLQDLDAARNPSAVVTKKLKELQAQGVQFGDGGELSFSRTTSAGSAAEPPWRGAVALDAWGKGGSPWHNVDPWSKGVSVGKGDQWAKGGDPWSSSWASKGDAWGRGSSWDSWSWDSAPWRSSWALPVCPRGKTADFQAGWAAALATLSKGGGK